MKPLYNVWEGVKAALILGKTALEEVQALKRMPGPQGLGWDDMEERLDEDGRTIVRTYRRGDQVKEFRHKMAVVLYRGVYKEGQAYDVGDTVTWGGSAWHCDTPTKDKPDGQQRCWTLMVKRGRDGKDKP